MVMRLMVLHHLEGEFAQASKAKFSYFNNLIMSEPGALNASML